jgi:hypothetical protein
MADVRLDFYDLDDELLPDVCMKCGAPSTVRPIKTFSWMPYWARFMPWGIGMAFMKRRRVPIPLCEQHKNHWVIRYIVIFGGLGLFLLFFICGGIVTGIGSDQKEEALQVVGGLMLAVGGLLFLAWIVTAIVLGVTQINVFEITDDTITLRNVSPEFTRAYREMARDGDIAPDVEEVAREEWNRRQGRRPRDADEPPRRRPPDLPPDDKYRRR